MKSRLTRAEINAIAQKLYKEVSAEIRKKNDENKKKGLEKFFRTKNGRIIKKLLDNPETALFIYKYAVENTARKYYPLIFLPSLDSITNELTIEQIDSKDVKKLIETVKAKFMP